MLPNMQLLNAVQAENIRDTLQVLFLGAVFTYYFTSSTTKQLAHLVGSYGRSQKIKT